MTVTDSGAGNACPGQARPAAPRAGSGRLFRAGVGGMLASSKCQPGWRAFDAHKKILNPEVRTRLPVGRRSRSASPLVATRPAGDCGLAGKAGGVPEAQRSKSSKQFAPQFFGGDWNCGRPQANRELNECRSIGAPTAGEKQRMPHHAARHQPCKSLAVRLCILQRAAGNDCTSICEPRCTITVCKPSGLGELGVGGSTNLGSGGGTETGNAAANCGITKTSSGSIQPIPLSQAKNGRRRKR